MEKMIVGTDIETIKTLHDSYAIPWKRARHMLDMARGVGPSPTETANGTIVIRYIRIPRTTKVLYEIIETVPRVDSLAALKILMDEYGFSESRAKVALNSAWEKGKRRISGRHGTIHITYHGRGTDDGYIFSIEGE